MDIKLTEITIQELAEGYKDNQEEGVVGYGGKLDIRPPYQREFIYKDAQRDAVIDTVAKNFPLNVMYWAVREDGNFEVIDGQQRTISICQYLKGDFNLPVFGTPNSRSFDNLQKDEREKILDYTLTVYLCSGTDSEKLEWFKTINIAGLKLTNQELRNAVYSGTWATDAKRYFSKRGCPAYKTGHSYLDGHLNRQRYLETAIKWISKNQIEKYMSAHQHDVNASALWRYFQDVTTWVEATFTNKRTLMKGVDWGPLYNRFKNKVFNAKALEKEIAKLLQDDDVTNQKGIYPYLLTREEKYLHIRAFSDAMKQKAYEKQHGTCVMCKKKFDIKAMEADHIRPWSKGGSTTEENCQMLCKKCNRAKGAR